MDMDKLGFGANGGNGGSVSREEMLATLAEHSHLIDGFVRDTEQLQKVDIDDKTSFESSIYRPTGEDAEGRTPMYTGIFNEKINMGDALNEVLIEADAEGADLGVDSEMIDLLKMLGGDVDMVVGFCLAVREDAVEVRMVRDGNIESTTAFKNVKSADDLLKLVSFYDAKYVDAFLKDFDVFKELLGA